MFPAVDIHILDVASGISVLPRSRVQHLNLIFDFQGGTILSQGDAEKAQQLLTNAAEYAKHQRVHYNALESLPLFFALSFAAGFRNPLTTSFHGLAWIVGRVAWFELALFLCCFF